MGFEKGHEKIGGRVAGTPNQTSRELRSILRSFIFNELETLPESFKTIKSAEKRLEILVKLLPYVIPKAQEFSLDMLSDSKLDLILEVIKNEATREN
jgi:hypothetical protein